MNKFFAALLWCLVACCSIALELDQYNAGQTKLPIEILEYFKKNPTECLPMDSQKFRWKKVHLNEKIETIIVYDECSCGNGGCNVGATFTKEKDRWTYSQGSIHPDRILESTKNGWKDFEKLGHSSACCGPIQKFEWDKVTQKYASVTDGYDYQFGNFKISEINIELRKVGSVELKSLSKSPRLKEIVDYLKNPWVFENVCRSIPAHFLFKVFIPSLTENDRAKFKSFEIEKCGTGLVFARTEGCSSAYECSCFGNEDAGWIEQVRGFGPNVEELKKGIKCLHVSRKERANFSSFLVQGREGYWLFLQTYSDGRVHRVFEFDFGGEVQIIDDKEKLKKLGILQLGPIVWVDRGNSNLYFIEDDQKGLTAISPSKK